MQSKLNEVIESLKAGKTEHYQALGVTQNDVSVALEQLESLKTNNVPNLINLVLCKQDDQFAARFFINILDDNPTRQTFVEASAETLARMYQLTKISEAIAEYKEKHKPSSCSALMDIEELSKLLADCKHNCSVNVSGTVITIPANVLRAAIATSQNASQHMK